MDVNDIPIATLFCCFEALTLGFEQKKIRVSKEKPLAIPKSLAILFHALSRIKT